MHITIINAHFYYTVLSLRIPLRMGVLNLVHEMMHSFGAKHDPDASQNPDCTPKDKVRLISDHASIPQ